LENLIYSSNVAHNNNIIVPGTDPGVFQGGGGGGGGGGWYLGATESMVHAYNKMLQFRDWNQIEDC